MSQGLRGTFLVHAIAALVFGIIMFLIPTTGAEWLRWPSADPAATRLAGAVTLAIALSSWLGFRAMRREEVRIIVEMEIAYSILGALAGLYEVLVRDAPTAIWLFIAIYVVFGLAWIYFYSQQPTTIAAAATR